MTDPLSCEYDRQRENRERELAELAHDELIAAIHLEMANRYSHRSLVMQDLARLLDEDPGIHSILR